MEISCKEVDDQVKVGRTSIEYDNFYLQEISREFPEIEIEEYQIEFGRKSYDGLISVYADARNFPILSHRAKCAIQRGEPIESFKFIGEISDRAFYEVKVNDIDYEKHPIRYLQDVNGAFFPTRVMPVESKQGRLYIYGMFENEKTFRKCIEILNREKGIAVQTDECGCWAIDLEDAFRSVPTVFNALGIGFPQEQVLIRVLLGNPSSVAYLRIDTNFLDILFSSDILRNMRFLDVMTSAGIENLIDILKEIFMRE
jgi:hypothetical protein